MFERLALGVAKLRLVDALVLGLNRPHLHGDIAVPLGGFELGHHVWSGVNDGRRIRTTILRKYGHHLAFCAKYKLHVVYCSPEGSWINAISNVPHTLHEDTKTGNPDAWAGVPTKASEEKSPTLIGGLLWCLPPREDR